MRTLQPKCNNINDIPADAPPMRWTGSTVDLIELLYGLDTLKYINGGETGMGELLGHIQQENIPSRQKFAEKCLSLQKQS